MSIKISNDVKLIIVQNILNNVVSFEEVARSLGVAYQRIQRWIAIYRGIMSISKE
ncbi:transposase [Clostridium taeniosporum]|uniref:transposase n=1 Tax=Clostridium taeniosporum TaxID=394958 RepID=UPI000F740FE9|nr:transposase [Clostridium taeniosporum]